MISFSSITDCPKLNLDQINDWYITNNILKDPPKSFNTRRITKVGENNELLNAIDASLDRNDAIRQYATGVNHMVEVNYNNTTMRTSNTQAFLPYRIIKDGAFRPPILYQQDTLPLSRLPRYTTSLNVPAGNIDYSKWERPSEDSKKFNQIGHSLHVTQLSAPRSYSKIIVPTDDSDIPCTSNYIENKPQRIIQRNGSIQEGSSKKYLLENTDNSWRSPNAPNLTRKNKLERIKEEGSSRKKYTQQTIDDSWYATAPQYIKYTQPAIKSVITNPSSAVNNKNIMHNTRSMSNITNSVKAPLSTSSINTNPRFTLGSNISVPVVKNEIHNNSTTCGSFENIGTISRFSK
jgi:hypothetical protein